MKSNPSRTLFRTLFATGLIAASLCSCCPKTQHLTQAEIADGWQLLFDGKSLDQWKDFNGDSLTMPWHVVDGCIQAAGDGSDLSGYIVNKSSMRTSSSTGTGSSPAAATAACSTTWSRTPISAVPMSQGWVPADRQRRLGRPRTPDPARRRSGRNWAWTTPYTCRILIRCWSTRRARNSSRIVCDNGHVEHWLNGRKILEFDAWTDDWFARKNSGKWETAPEYGLAQRGVICLQDHGYPASFRNLKIKELPRKAGREVELFNGRDLTGWEAYGTEKWYVDKEGNLVCESGPDKQYGYLATREYYDDFDLTVEFKQLANGNSGVFFRSFVEPPVKVHGWQCEVAPKNHDTAGIYESYGRGWLVQIPDEKESILKEGDWNTLRLKVQGDRVQTWLNGEEMVDITDAKIGAAQGRIALQIHDGGGIKVLWRNIRLTTL